MIAIVTDSTICISRAEAAKLGLFIVPQTYHVFGQMFTEGFQGENGRFEELLKLYGSTAKTAHAGIGAFLSTYETLLGRGFEVLAITMSSRLSGAYSAASMAAGELPGRPIRVVDSLTTAGGLTLLCRAVRENIRGGAGLDEAARFAHSCRDEIGTVFSVDNMDALRRSGRIGFVRQSVTTILNIRPVLLCRDGMVISEGMERGQNALITRMASMIPKDASEIIVMDGSNPRQKQLLWNAVGRRFPHLKPDSGKIGPVLSVHLGLGVLGAAWRCPAEAAENK